MIKRNMYATSEWRKWRRKFNNELMEHQVKMLDAMIDSDKLTGAYPTGTGKSRIIYGDILEHIQESTPDVFVIASHRLLLNVQHLKEVFYTFEKALSNIGFVFVGSHQIDITRFNQKIENNKFLSELKLNYKDLMSTETNAKGLKEKIDAHMKAGRDIIIISTYHSLGKLRKLEKIHTFYGDEAHILASTSHENGKEKEFEENYKVIQKKIQRNFFFTATPKDAESQAELSFLMNNKDVFGERVGLSFREATEKGLIVTPKIHLIESDKLNRNRDKVSGTDYAKVIIETFQEHEKELKIVSSDFSQVAPKILIKCPSVKDIWNIRRELMKTYSGENVQLFAGASWSEKKLDESFYHNGDENGLSKLEFLEKIQDLKNNKKAIILHYDILSEGIDVPGITGVMFLSKMLPKLHKVVQTIGRSTRLHPIDRKKLFTKQLAINEKKKWIKPYCYVMLPVLTDPMENEYMSIKDTIRMLRTDYGFTATINVSNGKDKPKGDKKENDETLNDQENKNAKSLWDNLSHDIEKDIELTREIEESEVMDAVTNFAKRHSHDSSVTVEHVLENG